MHDSEHLAIAIGVDVCYSQAMIPCVRTLVGISIRVWLTRLIDLHLWRIGDQKFRL